MELVAEPMAAGQQAAEPDRTAGAVAVYDLGGGTLDAAVLERTGAGAWRVLGPPGGLDPLGGETFDLLLHRYLLTQLEDLDPQMANVLDAPSNATERGFARTWWRDLRSLKEDLSEVSSGRIAVPGSENLLLLSRAELEDLLGEAVRDSVDEFEQVVHGASISSDFSIVVAGDASRMPLVHELIRERFGDVPVASVDDPKGAVAAGALTMVQPPVVIPLNEEPVTEVEAGPPTIPVPIAPGPVSVPPLSFPSDPAGSEPSEVAAASISSPANSSSSATSRPWVLWSVGALSVLFVVVLAVVALRPEPEPAGGSPGPIDLPTTTRGETPSSTDAPPAEDRLEVTGDPSEIVIFDDPDAVTVNGGTLTQYLLPGMSGPGVECFKERVDLAAVLSESYAAGASAAAATVGECIDGEGVGVVLTMYAFGFDDPAAYDEANSCVSAGFDRAGLNSQVTSVESVLEGRLDLPGPVVSPELARAAIESHTDCLDAERETTTTTTSPSPDNPEFTCESFDVSVEQRWDPWILSPIRSDGSRRCVSPDLTILELQPLGWSDTFVDISSWRGSPAGAVDALAEVSGTYADGMGYANVEWLSTVQSSDSEVWNVASVPYRATIGSGQLRGILNLVALNDVDGNTLIVDVNALDSADADWLDLEAIGSAVIAGLVP